MAAATDDIEFLGLDTDFLPWLQRTHPEFLKRAYGEEFITAGMWRCLIQYMDDFVSAQEKRAA